MPSSDNPENHARNKDRSALMLMDLLEWMVKARMRVRELFAPTGVGRTFFGARMHCDTRDFIQRRIFYFGIYEPNLTHYIASMLRPGEQFLDIGANCGYMTLLAASIVGSGGKVVAIEASPRTFSLLAANLKLNGRTNVVPLNVAATGRTCEIAIVESAKRNIGANGIRPATAADAVVVKGDAISAMHEIERDRITFIKIDIEGSERPVLEDILSHIDDFKSLRNIAVEISAESADMIGRFQAAGFRAYVLPNNYRIGYLVARQYLSLSEEQAFVVKRLVSTYESDHRDYVFERL